MIFLIFACNVLGWACQKLQPSRGKNWKYQFWLIKMPNSKITHIRDSGTDWGERSWTRELSRYYRLFYGVWLTQAFNRFIWKATKHSSGKGMYFMERNTTLSLITERSSRNVKSVEAGTTTQQVWKINIRFRGESHKTCKGSKKSKTTDDKIYVLGESRDSRQNASENELEIAWQQQFEIETASMESIKIIMRERNFEVKHVPPWQLFFPMLCH